MQPFVDSTEILSDGPALAARIERDGYLFIRGLLPADAVRNVRQQLLEVAAEGGWLSKDAPMEASLADQAHACCDPEPDYLKVFRKMWVNEDLHALKHHRNLVGLFDRMFGEPTLVHPLFVQRNIFPQTEGFDFTTRAHQDVVHIGGGTSYAAWVPLGDCPMSKGGLRVAAGSHKYGVLDFRVGAGPGGMEIDAPPGCPWVASDFRAGDVLIFCDTTVHMALPNRSPELRQSFDSRYQRLSDPVSDLSMAPYGNLFTWDEVYAGWKSRAYQYYWRDLRPTIVPFDTSYYDRRDTIAFEMAERGDRKARDTLLRILQRDRNPTKRERANALLTALDAMSARGSGAAAQQ